MYTPRNLTYGYCSLNFELPNENIYIYIKFRKFKINISYNFNKNKNSLFYRCEHEENILKWNM